MEVTRILVFGWLAVLVGFITILSFIISFKATRPVMEIRGFSLSPTNFSYKIYTEQKTWKHAQLSCYGSDARLVQVDSQEEQKNLRSFIRKNGTPKDELSGYWMGGFKKNSTWTWASTGEYVYKHYAAGWHFYKPDNSTLENGHTKDCMEMQWINTGNGSLSWNNIHCLEKRQYICQRFY